MSSPDQVQVAIRIRPLIQREQQAELDARWNVKDEKFISQTDQPHLPPYVFDKVYDRDCTTWDLYSGTIAPIVEAAMNGYHGTVFAYGQSGSGKTYTMSGNKMTPGIIAQAMNDIFDFIEQKPSHEFLMRASFMEIYNEKIYDLLTKEDKHLKLQETPDQVVHVVGLEERMVNSCQQALGVIQKGETNRTFAQTKQNERSSRSHCIFRIIIESRLRNEQDSAVMVSHLNFVDLAGSEKAGENTGDRFREGCSINKSLFCLSNVISKLSEGVSNQFIGYRNSKLTRILQNALGGNSKTVIVATINPTTVEESHSTMKFATRAKSIKNSPHVNEVLSEAAMLRKYRNEISRLQRLVKDIGVEDIQSTNEGLKKQLADNELLIKELKQQIVVSSVTDTTVTQKKKMRRETWCAPKVQAWNAPKQHTSNLFPALPGIIHPQVTIREETALDLELAQVDGLDSSFSTASNAGVKARNFLYLSEEMMQSDTFLKAGEEDSQREVERLEEVISTMETEHQEEVNTLQQRINQLESGQAGKDKSQADNERMEEVIRLMEEDHATELETLQSKIKQMELEKAEAEETGQSGTEQVKETICLMESEHAEQLETLQARIWQLESEKEELQNGQPEVEQLKEVIRMMETESIQQIESLQERIKQVEFERAVHIDHQEEKESEKKDSTSNYMQEIVRLQEELKHMEHSYHLTVVENKYLQSLNCHAEEETKRLEVETNHLCSKRFDFSLQEWEKLEASKASLEAEMKQMVLTLQEKEKEIAELQKALAGQDPYIARLEEQLEAYMGASSGQLGSTAGGSRRRSGIPVPLKEDKETYLETEKLYSEETPPVLKVDSTTSTDDLPGSLMERKVMIDTSMLAEQLPSHPCSETSALVPEELEASMTSQTECNRGVINSPQEPTNSLGTIHSPLPNKSTTCSSISEDSVLNTPASSDFTLENTFVRCKEEGVGGTESEKADKTNTPESIKKGKMRCSSESSTRLATRLKRRSDGTASLPFDVDAEVLSNLRKRENDIEQLTSDNARMLEMLNQANAEIVRFKEVIEAMEQADSERMEELAEVGKLRSLLSRRDMEIQRLELLSDRLKEDLNQQTLNSSTSSLSLSFSSEQRRKSSMLREREAEVWKLKDQLVQQAKLMEDIQQEKFALEDMVSGFQQSSHVPGIDNNDAEYEGGDSSCRMSSTSSSSSHTLSSQPLENEKDVSMNDDAEQMEEEEKRQVVVTMEELESVQKMLIDKDSLISRLKSQLQEKEQEMEQMFDGQMLIPSDMIQTHLQQAEQQKQQIEDLTEQLTTLEKEASKLRAKDTLHKSSSASSQEDNSTFQEQLIMDKMSLEEVLQEKEQELAEALERNQDLQHQLDEKRSTLNDLRQKHEDMTEALLHAQEQLVMNQKSAEEPHINILNQPSEKSLSKEERVQEPSSTETKSTENQDGECVSVKSVTKEEQVSELSTMESDAKEEDVSFEISFKTTSFVANTTANAEDIQSQMLRATQTREQNLLDMLEEKEERINTLTETVQSLQAVIPSGMLDSKTLVEELTVLKKEKSDLESKLKEVDTVLEEKNILESKVKELLTVVEQKSDVISVLRMSSKVAGPLTGMQNTENVESTELSKNTKPEIDCSKESIASLQAKLDHLSDVENCLEQNIKQLEQTQEEKEALRDRVQQLEAMLENLTPMEGLTKDMQLQVTNLQSEKESLDQQVKELSAQVESLQSLLDLKTSTSDQSPEALEPDVLLAGNEAAHKDMQVQELSPEADSLRSEIEELKSDNDKIAEEKNALEKEIQNLLSQVQQGEQMQEELTASCKQREALEKAVQELTSKLEEQNRSIEQIQSDHEEVASELTWQTKACEELQNRVVELETEISEQKQENDELIQELEKAQKLQEASEQCKLVVEETLEDFKTQNEKLEADKLQLATERDEFELKEEAAHKDLECLRLEFKVSTDRLEDRVSTLMLEVDAAVQRKEVLEAALADRESTQHMSELLHEKLSSDLQASQTQVVSMRTTLSELQSTLQSLDTKYTNLEKTKKTVDAEKTQLERDNSALELEIAELKESLETAKGKEETLQEELVNKEQANKAEIANSQEEIKLLLEQLQQLQQQGDSSNTKGVQLQQELEKARADCQHLETQCRQAKEKKEEATNALDQMQQAKKEAEERAAAAQSDCSQYQDELGHKLDTIEQLQKELESTRTSEEDSSSVGSDKMVPLIDVKKQKFVLKNKIRHLNQDLQNIKEAFMCQKDVITDLQEKLTKYENEEQEDKEEKIELLENNIKAKDFEIVGLKMQHRDDLSKLKKRLSSAEEMVTYKEDIIGKLKGEIRRMRSEEVSFCAPPPPAAPKVKPTVTDERAISSHSGIIDRYTVTLLEADKHKLQKELKKTQDRLKHRESELHWAKVALAKAKPTGSSPPTSSSSSSTSQVEERNPYEVGPVEGSAKLVRKSLPVLATPERGIARPAQSPRPRHSIGGPRSSVVQKLALGTSVDGSSIDSDMISINAMLRQDDRLLHDSIASGGTSVDVKKDRPLLPSAVDKENTPMGTHLLADKVSTVCSPDYKAGGDSPINIEPEFWKKPRHPPASLYRPASKKSLGKAAAAGAEQCKTQ